MTESEWQTSQNPIAMIAAQELPIKLDDVNAARWRLFSAGCLRLLWPQLSETPREAVLATEDYALGLQTADHLLQYVPESVRQRVNPDHSNTWYHFRWAFLDVTEARHADPDLQAIIWQMTHVTDFERDDRQFTTGYQAERAYSAFRLIQTRYASLRAGPATQECSDPDHPWHAAFMSACADINLLVADLLRCVVGNPFRQTVMDPAWKTSTVEGLLRGIHEEKAYDRLPILADALQEAGCEDDFFLSHCRFQGRHSIGCWAAHLPDPAPTPKPSSYWLLTRTS